MSKIKSVEALDNFGRIRVSKSFFMRDFLYSEIANFHGIPNIPEDPDLAVHVAEQICENLLEPLQDTFGRLAIRSAYRSKEVNGFGNAQQKAKKKGYNCASNEANYAHHIWDERDADGYLGGTVCLVVPTFAKLYEDGMSWTALAWWIHDNLPYNSQYFFPKRAALNLNWHENPKRKIQSYVSPKGTLTQHGMENHSGDHSSEYQEMLARIGVAQ